jgi:hypothetical protein
MTSRICGRDSHFQINGHGASYHLIAGGHGVAVGQYCWSHLTGGAVGPLANTSVGHFLDMPGWQALAIAAVPLSW